MDGFEKLDIQKEFKFSDDLFLQKNRIVLIIENLISNAIKYQDPKKERPFIKLLTHKTDKNDFVLEVHDNGLGIPKENQKKLFLMFQRFHPKTSFGSGLGLYMTIKGKRPSTVMIVDDSEGDQ